MSDPVAPGHLADFVTRTFVRLGAPVQDAERVAGLMVEADLLGHDRHGVFRPRPYANRLPDGGCNATARPRVLRETVATALIKGDNGLGDLAMARDLVTDKARGAGIGSPTYTCQFVGAANISVPGHDPLRVPGDGRNTVRAAALSGGIALYPKLRAELDRVALDLDLAPL